MTTYHGEIQCETIYKSGKNVGKRCENRAYWDCIKEKGRYRCGMHSRNITKTELLKDPKAKEKRSIEIYNMLKEAESIQKQNFDQKKKGKLIVRKMYIMKKIDYVKGYYPVFPNIKHQNRKDGFGMSSLSPMVLGPVLSYFPYNEVKIIKIPNIENYYQGAKQYICDINYSNMDNIHLNDHGYNKLLKMYEDIEPHRHKYTKKELDIICKDIDIKKPKIYKPVFSVYYNKYGIGTAYTYIESRYFYCYWYKKLATKTDEYLDLIQKLENGYNLCIYGYDGRPVRYSYEKFSDENFVDGRPVIYKGNDFLDIENQDLLKKIMYDIYLDISKPFGHELVLYSLLTIEHENDYPWNIYYSKNKDLYKNIF
uniref:Uncharacterized protein n=1 Tax=Pithovirus LCDPAC02 TaxID=2506601 RepID=A0A481YNJ4_9VIRU|nr:MAG: uncharacterized protein LCDPAC02_00610 [Pithovirus LCDPAC02]